MIIDGELVPYGPCHSCNNGNGAAIHFHGYAEGEAEINLCLGCAKQLARKLLEDICDCDSPGGRHG